MKVMFSQASVCARGVGVSAPLHAGIHNPPPLGRHPPPSEQTPPHGQKPNRQIPPGQCMLDTVNKRAVRISLECILVYNAVDIFDCKYVNIYLPVWHKIWHDVKASVTKFHDQLRRVFFFQLFVPYSSEGMMRSILNIYIIGVITFAGKLKIQL